MAAEKQNFQFTDAFRDIISERNLDDEMVRKSIEGAIRAAIEEKYGSNDNVTVDFQVSQGVLNVTAKKVVVSEVEDPIKEISLEMAQEIDSGYELGDKVEEEIDPTQLGRTAITEAKKMLMQEITDASRQRIFEEYKDKVGEVVNGRLQRFERGNVIINLGDAEGMIPKSMQIPGENYQRGTTIRAYVKAVERNEEKPQRPQIILSRRAPEFLKKLFEFEVPEIYEGRVTIKAVAREPGNRAKVAVSSKESKIDPVGACVGLKGVRVQSVVRELNNEKIDIVRYSEDPKEFVSRSLAPAGVIESFIDEDEKSITVIVNDDEVSLAIGRGGQNARLAAKLTNWCITLYGKKQYKESLRSLSELESLSEDEIDALKTLNINSLQKFLRTDVSTLVEVTNIEKDKLKELLQEAEELVNNIDMENAFVVDSNEN